MTDEEQKIRDVLAGKTESFRWIVERYQGPVFQMVANLIGDRSAAEDIVQDIFVTIYQKLASHDSMRSRFSTWLFVIARHKSINHLRRQRLAGKVPAPPTVSTCDPSERLCQAEMIQQLDAVLEQLPAPQKRVFVLAEFEELPYDQIAQIECISLGTVRTRLHRAKKRIQKAFEDVEKE